jgi:hypothetical protein
MDLTKDSSKTTNLTIALAAAAIIGLGGGLGLFMRGDGQPAQSSQKASEANAHPLEPWVRGYVQCFNIDVATKTCEGILSYVNQGDGTWSNTSIALLDPKRPWTLTMTGPVYVKNGTVCSVLRPEHLNDMVIDYGERGPPSELRAYVRSRVDERLGTIVNKEACSVYYEDLGAGMVKATIDGMETDYPHMRVRWVLPSEGYRVAPRKTFQ